MIPLYGSIVESVKRPSSREIDKRIREARDALKSGFHMFSNPNKVVGELMDLDVATEDLWPLIGRLLDEIRIEDYAGQYPPKKNYEPLGTDCELWAFSWKSELLGKWMYLKFSVNSGWFYYVSLHESRHPGQKDEV